jgi:hypothetical protein
MKTLLVTTLLLLALATTAMGLTGPAPFKVLSTTGAGTDVILNAAYATNPTPRVSLMVRSTEDVLINAMRYVNGAWVVILTEIPVPADSWVLVAGKYDKVTAETDTVVATVTVLHYSE